MVARHFSAAMLLAAAGIMPAYASAPLSAGLVHPKLNPGYHTPPDMDFRLNPMHDAVARNLASGTLQSLPSWTRGFTISGKSYSYTLLGSDPALGGSETIIPTIIVPVRLTILDDMNRGHPLILDGTQTMPALLNSPIFQKSKYDTGTMQFTDAMLHADFPRAPTGWHLTFSPSVAPTIDVTMPVGSVQTIKAKSGKILAILNNSAALNSAMLKTLRNSFAPNTYIVFVTYNALLSGAFGYHSALPNKDGTAAQVYTYTSWLEGVNDAVGLASPNADTLAHEAAEVVYDALGFSKTLLWGDWFNSNKCFQNYIEVGDAVEDATAKIQNWHQTIMVNGRPVTYALQVEALLPFFTREFPSPAIHGAYSFPSETAILGPAPLKCAH